MLWRMYGKAEVDLFAAQHLSQCPSWFAEMDEPGPGHPGSGMAKLPALCLSSSCSHLDDSHLHPGNGLLSPVNCLSLTIQAMVPANNLTLSFAIG